MAEVRHLPLGDTRRTKVAPPVEHEALEETLPVDNGTKNNSSFLVYFLLVNFFYLQYFLSHKGSFLFFQRQFVFT